MEEVIIYIIVAVIVVVSILRNYQKEQKKNKGRVVAQIPPLNQSTSVSRPFSRKTDTQYNNVPEIPPQSDQPVESAVQIQMNKYTLTNDLYNQQEMDAFSQEGTSSLSERAAFSDEAKNSNSSSASMDLQLNTSDDYRRAFLHTLIFDRKY